MNEKKKIALFMLPPLTQGGGAEKYFIELARNLNERGVRADIITMDENFFRKFARILHIFTRGNFFGKIDIKGREKEKDILQKLGKARWTKTGFKDLGGLLKKYDLIYTKNELIDLSLLKAKGYKNLPPIIVGVHTPIIYPERRSWHSKLHNMFYSSFFYKWLIRKAKCIHVSNSSAENTLQKKFKLESRLIYYPFSVRQIMDSVQNDKYDIKLDAGKKNIIFAGRLGEQKGIDALLDIISKIGLHEDMAEKVSLNILGSGEKKYEAAIKNLSQKYAFVRYFGHVENKYMPNILSQQDFLIAPSKWETLPYSILEAQAMGLPVIAFDIPGPSDIIESGGTGFLVKNNAEFFEKIIEITEGKKIFDKDMIVKNIEKKFSPEIIYPELIKMFQENL